MIGLTLFVLILKCLLLTHGGGCDGLTTSASCVAQTGCLWTKTSNGSCKAPVVTDCVVETCNTDFCNKGDAKCEDKDKISCGTNTNRDDCLASTTPTCSWIYPETGSCYESVCSYATGTCINEFGDHGPCETDFISKCEPTVFTDALCNALATGIFCVEDSAGYCKVEGENCVGVDSEDDEACEDLPVSPVGCDIIVSMTNGACKNDGGCKVDSTHTPYACKLDDSDCPADSECTRYCDDDSMASRECDTILPACNRHEGNCLVANADYTTCLQANGCTFIPEEEYCSLSGTGVDCSGATVTTTDGCSTFNTQCEFVGSSCNPKTPISCDPSNEACSESKIGSGCISTAEVGTCGSDSTSNSTFLHAQLWFLLVMLALLL